jgi:hypothetical protein
MEYSDKNQDLNRRGYQPSGKPNVGKPGNGYQPSSEHKDPGKPPKTSSGKDG